MRIIIILTFTLFLFTKCYTPSYDSEIKSLDSLSQAFMTSEQNLDKIDTNKIDKHYKNMNDNINKLVKKNKAQVNDNFKKVIEEYKTLEETFYKKYKIKYKELQNELENSNQQNSELKNKLTGGYIPKSTFDSYFRIEKQTSLKLNTNISQYIVNTENISKKSEELETKVSSMVH